MSLLMLRNKKLMNMNLDLRCKACNKLLLKYNLDGNVSLFIKCPRCKAVNELILKNKK